MCAEATADFLRYFNIVFFLTKFACMDPNGWNGSQETHGRCQVVDLSRWAVWAFGHAATIRIDACRFGASHAISGGSRYGFAPKHHPQNRWFIIISPFQMAFWRVHNFQTHTHTPYLSYMLHTYDCLWLSIDVCTSVQYMCDLVYACLDLAPACKTTKPLLKLVCEFGLPNFNPQEQQQKWSKD